MAGSRSHIYELLNKRVAPIGHLEKYPFRAACKSDSKDLCGSLLGRNSRGGTIVVGSATLGGSIELVPNAVQVVELAIEKQASLTF